jgi:hypothetical protein
MADEDLDALGITVEDFYREADLEINEGLDVMADDVLNWWDSIAPKDTGEYDSDLAITEIKDDDGHPARRVKDSAKYAHIVEYGSKYVDARSPRAKTAVRFGVDGKYMVDNPQ